MAVIQSQIPDIFQSVYLDSTPFSCETSNSHEIMWYIYRRPKAPIKISNIESSRYLFEDIGVVLNNPSIGQQAFNMPLEKKVQPIPVPSYRRPSALQDEVASQHWQTKTITPIAKHHQTLTTSAPSTSPILMFILPSHCGLPSPIRDSTTSPSRITSHRVAIICI